MDERPKQLLHSLAKRRGKSSSSSTSTYSHHGDEVPLPPQCARANQVCADDEPFAREKCANMIGNLEADAANTAKLVGCYKKRRIASHSRSADQMWFGLH